MRSTRSGTVVSPYKRMNGGPVASGDPTNLADQGRRYRIERYVAPNKTGGTMAATMRTIARTIIQGAGSFIWIAILASPCTKGTTPRVEIRTAIWSAWAVL